MVFKGVVLVIVFIHFSVFSEQAAIFPEKLTFKNCSAGEPDLEKMPGIDLGPKIIIEKETIENEKRNFILKANFFVLSPNLTPKDYDQYEFISDTPKSFHNISVWQSDAKTTYQERKKQEDSKTNIHYLEVPGKPLRKIFSVLTSRLEEDGETKFFNFIFDNVGNFVHLADRYSPKSNLHTFKIFLSCYPDNGDAFGFRGLALKKWIYHPAQPIVPPSLSNQIKFEEMKTSEDVKRFAESTLNDRDNLSPALEKWAKTLADGSYRNEFAWRLRSAIFEGLKP